MKLSTYIHPVKIDTYDSILLYNSYKDNYLVISNTLYQLLHQYSDHIIDLQELNNDLYQQLLNNGFIIDDNIDEKSQYLKELEERKTSLDSYYLIINPTLACNLSCWYCYENHLPQSRMDEKTIEHIIRHIKKKHREEHFSQLTLSFFGGEPFVCFDIVKRILQETNDFIQKHKINRNVHFTTNATLLTSEQITFLSQYHPTFQITLDGCRSEHDKTRIAKNKRPTYDTIIKNIQLLSWQEGIGHIGVRINFGAKTLDNLSMVVDDLKDCNKKKISIQLHRIWQVNEEQIDERKVFQFIRYAQSQHICANYLLLSYNDCSCYADLENEALINYDGNVFKCTARDFTPDNADGYLLADGTIQWNIEKMNKRKCITLQKMCLDCDLLPSCYKPCTQKLLEQGTVGCQIKAPFTKEDYIMHNLTNRLIQRHE